MAFFIFLDRKMENDVFGTYRQQSSTKRLSVGNQGKDTRRDSVFNRMKRVISSPMLDSYGGKSSGIEDYHSNRFELGVGERLEQDINRNVLKFRNVSSTNLLRRRSSAAPKTPDKYIGDARKRFRFYTVLDPDQLSGKYKGSGVSWGVMKAMN